MAGIKTLGFAVDDHDPRSWELYRFIADMDYEHGDRFCFKAGGDGDNGELLLAYLDEWYKEEVAGMTQSKWVQMGSVRRFDNAYADKEQALKVLEEASEVHGAWQAMASAELVHGGDCVLVRLWRKLLLEECADVIQATLNLAAALGVEDFRPYMKECEQRNRERGRITDGR